MRQKFKLVFAIKRNSVPYLLHDKHIDFNDLTFVHEGQLTYTIDGKTFTVSKGQAMYCPEGKSRYRLKNSEHAVYTSLNFKCTPENTLDLPYHILEADNFDLKFYLTKIIELYNKGGKYDKAKCDAFMSLVAYNLLENADRPDENKYISDIKTYIGANWNKKLTLDEIAASAHLSPSYSSALFKAHTGSSIIDYIIELRISKACDMLKYSDLLVSEIADSAGFCDIFYFSRMFKKHMGVSPAGYRNREKNNYAL